MSWHLPLELAVIIENSLSHPQWQTVLAQTQQNRPKAWYYCRHVSQTGWGSQAGMQCFPFSKHNTSYLNQKILFWSHLSIKHYSIHFQVCLHTHQQTVDRKQWFFGKQWLSACKPAMHITVVVLLKVYSWALTNVREAFNCLEVALGSFVTSQTIIRLALRVIFVGRPLSF